MDLKKSMLRHIVLLKFKDSITPEAINKVVVGFRALSSKIKEIKAFEDGTNNSPEHLNDGFTHCFFLSFSSEEDRDMYLKHPDHTAFVDILKPTLDKVMVFDYWQKQ